MRFSPEQIESFRLNGWIAVPDFWSAEEVGAMRADLERLKAENKLRNVATDHDGQTGSATKANLQLCPISAHSSLFRAMPFAPKAIEAIEQLIGAEYPVRLHLDQVFLKPGQHGAGTNWHQDNAYFQIENPLDGVALWTAVHDATAANGTMRVIPNAYREPLEHTRDPDSDHHLRCYPNEEEAVLVELPAGGALFFAFGTPHATGGNPTPNERAGVALHFVNARADESVKGGLARRPWLTGPQAEGGAEVYGETIAGTWPDEVKSALYEQVN